MSAAIGVFGGTFAPIHNGHLRLAIELCERLQLTELRLVPCGTPYHRAAPEVPAQRRLRWAELATIGLPKVVVDDSEIRRGGASYTRDTLAELRAELGEAVPIILLVGEDAANGLPGWHRWRELPELAHLVFVERPFEPPDRPPALTAALRGHQAHSPAELLARPAGLWLVASIPPLAISSTRIRRLLAAGRSVRGLVPEAVIRDFTPEDVHLLTHDETPADD